MKAIQPLDAFVVIAGARMSWTARSAFSQAKEFSSILNSASARLECNCDALRTSLVDPEAMIPSMSPSRSIAAKRAKMLHKF